MRRIAVAIVRKEVRQLAPRPPHLRHDRRHPDDAAPAVRLRHQQDVRHLRARASPTWPARQRRAHLVADMPGHPGGRRRRAGAQRRRSWRRCCGRGEISRGHRDPARFRAPPAARRPRRPRSCWSTAATPIVLGAARRSAATAARSRAASRDAAAPDTFEVRAFYNPERRSAVQIVPGLIGVILTMTMMLFTSVAIVRERERGNLELLITTPVTHRRADDRQDPALHGDRPGPGDPRPGGGLRCCSTCPIRGQLRRRLPAPPGVHRRHPRPGPADLDRWRRPSSRPCR